MVKAQSKTLVPNNKSSITDSGDMEEQEEQEEQCNNVMVIMKPKRAQVNLNYMSAKLFSILWFYHADINEVAYKMTEKCNIDYQDRESVDAEPMDSTMCMAPICGALKTHWNVCVQH